MVEEKGDGLDSSSSTTVGDLAKTGAKSAVNADQNEELPDDYVKPKKGILRFFLGSDVPPIPEEPDPYPEYTSSLWSRLTFSWITPVLNTGYKRTLQFEDLWKLEGTKVGAQELHERFEQHLEKYREMGRAQARAEGKSEFEIQNAPLPKYGLLRALHDTFFTNWWIGGGYKITSDVAQATIPLVTRKLINFTMYREVEPVGKGVGYGICTVIMFVIFSFCTNQYFYRAMTTGGRVRAVLSHSIYLKSLRLSPKARISYTNGQLTNLLSTDCHRIDFALQFFHFTWSFPISTGVCLAVVLVSIGASGLVGFALLFASFIGIGFMAKVMVKVRGQTSKITDHRVSIMREILQSMKVIKFYSWEDAYRDKVQLVRNKEMKKIKYMLVIRNIANAVFVSTPTLAGLISFVVLSATGGSLNPADVFSSLTSFNIMRMPLMMLPVSLMTSVDALVALKRIEKLLGQPEIEDYVQVDSEAKHAISITGDYIWEQADEEDEDNSKDDKKSKKEKKAAKKAKKAAEKAEKANQRQQEKEQDEITRQLTREASNTAESVHGQIMEKIEQTPEDSDEVDVKDTEDAPQFEGFKNISMQVSRGEFVMITGSIGSGKSSLLNAIAGQMRQLDGTCTIGGEIAFCGQPWIQNATVEENITFGKPFDQEWYDTVIKACSLTRDFEILPAGDQTEVGERGITLSGGQKARINLARAVYSKSDIILLDDVLSAVDAHVGQYILDNCLLGLLDGKTRLLASHQLAMLPQADRVIFVDNSQLYSGSIDELRATNSEFDRLMTYSSQGLESEEDEKDGPKESAEGEIDEEKADEAKKNNGALMQDEDRASNAVDKRVYMQFFKLGGGWLSYGMIPFLLLVMIVTTFTSVFTNTWLSFWTAHKFEGRQDNFYIGIFVMFGVLSSVFSFIFFYLLTDIGNSTSLKLHRAAINRVLHAPMTFFDTSPLGRILNRFTKDTDTMDNEISDQARLFLLSTSQILGVFILVIVYLPWFAIALVGLMVLFVLASIYYRASAREIKRMDSLGRSVVFSHFAETLNGISTIRAYGAEERFVNKNISALNRMNQAYFLTMVNQRWLGLRLDWVGAGLNLVVVMLCVTGQFNIDPSSVGLVLSSLLMVLNMMSLTVRELATVENNMNTVERIYHYAYDLDQEAEFKISETAPPPEWPATGKIEFDNVLMSYQPHLPPVLKDVSVEIKGGEKIGICGRTGAGKSTIMVALYRLCELTSGKITIDGLDISRLGLNQLRSKLSIIPQDPVLFQGTVRSNVDPFNTATDLELWDALKRSWLITDSEQNKFTLDSVVNDEGTNFSLGERQLLALARALVRNSQILIMDEATSSVDFETDSKIQSTIVNEFAKCTILCIAHRLRTILTYDRIMVMEAGQVVEFDTPLTLFNDENSVFRSMCDQSGITIEDFENNDTTTAAV